MAKVLIVEDDSLIVKIYTTRLQAEGFEVQSAQDGLEGVTKMREFVPDVVLLDVMMPKLDGFGLVTEIKKDPKLQTIPIIMYSNMNNEEEIQRAKSLGVVEFLIKANLTPNQVIEKIKQYLPNYDSARNA